MLSISSFAKSKPVTRGTYRLVVLIGLLATLCPLLASAHSPHDVVNSIALARHEGERQIYVVLNEDTVLRSRDGAASWFELEYGLDTDYPLGKLSVLANEQGPVVYLSTRGGGIYIKRPGDGSWEKHNSGLLDLDIVALQGNSATGEIVAADAKGVIYLSSGADASWRQLAESRVVVTALALVPGAHGSLLYVGSEDGGILVYSLDGSGQATEQGRYSVVPGKSITAIASVAKEGASTLYVASNEGGVLRSTDEGANFEKFNDGLDDLQVMSLSAARIGSADYLYAASWSKAIYRTTSESGVWQPFSQGISTDPQAKTEAPHIGPQFRDIAIEVNGDGDVGSLFLAGFDGFFMSDDQGEHWREIETLSPGRLVALAVSPSDGSGGYDVAVSTYGAGAYLYTPGSDEWRVINKGLENTRLTDLRFSPDYAQDQRFFSAAPGQVLLGDRNGPWQRYVFNADWYERYKGNAVRGLLKLGLPGPVEGYLKSLLPHAPFPSFIAVSPLYPKNRTLYVTTRRSGLFVTRDGGDSFERVRPDLPDISDLVIGSEENGSDTLYAASRSIGVLKSDDGGKIWRPVNSGLTFLDHWYSDLNPATFTNAVKERLSYYDLKLAISPNYARDGVLFVAGVAGIYRSEDRGEHWQPVKLALPDGATPGVLGIGVSPNYAADRTVVAGVKGMGLFVSHDGGLSFQAAGTAEHTRDLHAFGFSPAFAADGIFYAMSDQLLYVSKDGGKTVEPIERPVRYEAERTVIQFNGEWAMAQGAEFSAGKARRVDRGDASLAFDFVGTGARVLGKGSGDLTVTLDGVAKQVAAGKDGVLMDIESLAYGPHHLEAQWPSGQTNDLAVDAIDVLGHHLQLR